MTDTCLICLNDKQLPSSCIEKLCCSSSIKNEPLMVLKCCGQKCHRSCLDTYIIVNRDNGNITKVTRNVSSYCAGRVTECTRYTIVDPCPHCKQPLDHLITFGIGFENLKEYNDYLKKCKDDAKREKNIRKNIRNYKICNFWLPLILIATFIIVSPVVYSTKAEPKYISLCANSNLTFPSGTFGKEYVCRTCLIRGNEDDFMKAQGIMCPGSLKSVVGGFLAYLPNLIVQITYFLVMICLSHFATEISEAETETFQKNSIRNFGGTIWVSFIWAIRITTIILYFKLILDPVDHINDLNEINNLHTKYILMDVLIGSVVGYPFIIYGILKCCSWYGCSEKINRSLRKSHYASPYMIDISGISLSNPNEISFKKSSDV
jgi:NADH:ubiquinone oxidoreductase subunit 6 (subunit J)